MEDAAVVNHVQNLRPSQIVPVFASALVTKKLICLRGFISLPLNVSNLSMTVAVVAAALAPALMTATASDHSTIFLVHQANHQIMVVAEEVVTENCLQ